MLRDKRKDDSRVLTALTFVNSDGICKHQFVQFMKLIAHEQRSGLFLKFNFERGVLFADIAYPTYVPVEHTLVIVVAHLHDLVTDTQETPTPLHLSKR